MILKTWHKTAMMIAMSVSASIMAYVAISEPWYHYHDLMYSEDSDWNHEEEDVFLLDKWTVTYYGNPNSTTYTMSYHQGSNFWVPLEPMHSFMATIETLLQFCIALPLVSAVLALSRFQIAHLVVCAASAGILASVPIAFLLGFVDAYNQTDLIFVPDEIPSFAGDETTGTLLVTRTVWGPVSAWWLMLGACAVQMAGRVLALKFRKAKTV